MRATTPSRAAFVSLLLMVTGLYQSPFPVIDSAAAWFTTFSGDHDADYLLRGVTEGFSYDFVDPEPGGPPYAVPNYVPEERFAKVDTWVKGEVALGRYAEVSKDFLRGTAALGVVDKDHSNFEKVRVVHDFSRPLGTSTNLGISYVKASFASPDTAFSMLRPDMFMAKVDLSAAYRSIPAHPKH